MERARKKEEKEKELKEAQEALDQEEEGLLEPFRIELQGAGKAVTAPPMEEPIEQEGSTPGVTQPEGEGTLPKPREAETELMNFTEDQMEAKGHKGANVRKKA